MSQQEHEQNNSTEGLQPAKPRKWLKRLTTLFFLFLIGAVALGAYGYMQFQSFLKAPISVNSDSYQLHIKSGSSAYRVAQQLHDAGYLSQPKWFVWYLRYLKKQNIIKAGEFVIQPKWTIDELIASLEQAKTVQYPATIIAGQTIDQVLQTLQALPKLKKELDITDVKSLQALLSVEAEIDPKYPYASIEGRILPETYYYQFGDSDKDLFLRAFKASEQVLKKHWQKRDKKLPYKTPYEALIMASIVEKETGYAPERPLIAGVFVRRMHKGMRLQTDPTVIYGIGKEYDGNIRKRDLLAKTPYNTYTINRLPPTPIALPSAEAIEAALNPEATKALYFVAKGGGQHHFSKTLKEHNRAVRKYLLNK